MNALAKRDLGMDEETLRVKLRDICGHRPFMPLLYPEEMKGEWIGWTDPDVLMSSAVYDLVRDADKKGADLIAPARHSNFENFDENTDNIHWSYGPLMTFRRSKYDTVIAHVLRGYLRDPEKPVPGVTFDEWGYRLWGGDGYENSMSGLLDGLISHHLLTPYELPPDFPTIKEPPLFDGCCSTVRQYLEVCQGTHEPVDSSCGYCKYNDSSGVAHLSGVDGSPYLMCHFQFGKHDWPPDEATYHHAAALAASTSSFLTPATGVWFVSAEDDASTSSQQ